MAEHGESDVKRTSCDPMHATEDTMDSKAILFSKQNTSCMSLAIGGISYFSTVLGRIVWSTIRRYRPRLCLCLKPNAGWPTNGRLKATLCKDRQPQMRVRRSVVS